uniref:F-box domain-containing protein n=1 Tax=viral metagenome TaxID=1070528 RepID=A0A6C0C7E5_9ZZZZ
MEKYFLSLDVSTSITIFLQNKEIIALTATCTKINQLKYKIIRHGGIDLSKVGRLSRTENGLRYGCRSDAEYRLIESFGVTHLSYNYGFNERITQIIPSTITHVTFNDHFNQSIVRIIPSSVIHLEFGHLFNQPIKNSIPNGITHLRFGDWFDQSIKKNIPKSVTHLKFGRYFDQPIQNHIPSVTHLTVGTRFNQSIRYCPVTHLSIILNVEHITSYDLSSPLAFKKRASKFYGSLKYCKTIKHVTLDVEYCGEDYDKVMKIIKLFIGHIKNNLIPSISKLTFERNISMPLGSRGSLYDEEFDQALENIPSYVEEIVLSSGFFRARGSSKERITYLR